MYPRDSSRSTSHSLPVLRLMRDPYSVNNTRISEFVINTGHRLGNGTRSSPPRGCGRRETLFINHRSSLARWNRSHFFHLRRYYVDQRGVEAAIVMTVPAHDSRWGRLRVTYLISTCYTLVWSSERGWSAQNHWISWFKHSWESRSLVLA